MNETYQKKPRQKYIRCLERRAEYLEKRITTSGADLSYDKAECNALKWAVQILRELYPSHAQLESPDAKEESQARQV